MTCRRKIPLATNTLMRNKPENKVVSKRKGRFPLLVDFLHAERKREGKGNSSIVLIKLRCAK